MTDASLRDRFGVAPKKAATISSLIKEAVEDGFIRPYEEGQAKKSARCLPFWA